MAEGLSGAIAPSAAQHALTSEELHRADGSLGKRMTAVPGVSSEWPNARVSYATRVICGYYSVAGSKLELSAVEMDTATQQTRNVASVTGPVEQLPMLTVRLAQALGYATQAALTNDNAALRSFAMAVDAPRADVAASQYQAALAADPAFGAAYVGWARSAAALRDRAGFERAMAQAAPHAAQMPPFNRATLAALQAEALGDTKARLATLRDLRQAAPADAVVLRYLGDAELAAGNYPAGIAGYQQALLATPADADLHNVLAYAYLTQGDEAAALREGAAYGRLAEGANPVDTLGDIQFHFNHFGEALKSYLESYRRDPELDAGGSLEKAAVSALLGGDLAKADEIHQRYVRERAARRDPLAALRHADWLFLTGKRAAALDAARQFATIAAVAPQLQAAALTRIAAWQLQLGASSEAAQSAQVAMALRQPGTADLAALLAVFSEPLEDAAFEGRIAQLYPGPANQERRLLAEGYHWLFRSRWDRALPVWNALSRNPSAQTARAIYAWVLLQSGDKAGAGKMAATTPVWHPNQSDVFGGVWFPRLIAVRAATGAGGDAGRDARVYREIGGG